MKSIIFIFLLIAINSNAQKRTPDKGYLLGYMNTGEYASKTLTDKGMKASQDKQIVKNKPIAILSARRYTESFQYFEVAYAGETFFVYREHVTLSDESGLNFNDLLKADAKTLDSIRVAGIEFSKLSYQLEVKKASLFMNNCKKVGLLIIDKSIYDQSEYTEGTSFECEVLNLSNKTIKYITFSIQGYNAVSDKVSSIKILKGIGPIEKSKSAKYTFEYMWLTDIIDSFKIVSIKIEYMDGTIKTILDTNSIYDSNDYLDFLSGNETF